MSTLTDEEFAELAAKYGGESRVRRQETCFGTVVVRKPNRAEARRAVSLGLLDQTFQKTVDAVDPLLRACVIHPTRQQLDEWIEDQPLMPLKFAGDFIELTNGEVRESKKGSPT
jgi:hypothetical protein